MRYIAVFPTMTLSQKAQRVLRREGIRSEVVKVDSSLTRRGCSWGVAFDAEDLFAVRMQFSTHAINERELIRE